MNVLREEVPPYDAPMVASRSELPYGAPISERVEFLFQRIPNPETGSEYINADVARASEELTVPEVAAIRDGELDSLFRGAHIADSAALYQIIDLASAFGVSPSYFTEDKAPLFSSEIARIFLSKVRSRLR